MAFAVPDELPVEFDCRHTWDRRTNGEDVIAPEVKLSVMEMVTNDLLNVVEEYLHDILGTSFHNVQSGMWYVDSNLVKQVIVEMVHKEVFEETLKAHIAKIYGTDEVS